MSANRRERDSLGEVEVPEGRLWGAQTQRCLINFPIGAGRYRWGRPVIRALGIVKKCAAVTNGKVGGLSETKVRLIVQASQEVMDGRWDEEFPLTVYQTGSGTQTNMNANEVIATRANQLAEGGAPIHPNPVHPNDDANRSQSSNDVFPTVMHIATVEQVEDVLEPQVATLRHTLARLAGRYADVVMMGRTHLQDAAPVTLGQVISGWVAQLDYASEGIQLVMPGLLELAVGGTAVGTGLNAPAGFGELLASAIASETGKPFVSAPNKFAALSAHDAMVSMSGALRTLATALFKIANDVRWYASGPSAGIGELTLPANEPGSSIMPGKVNPTQCEALMQACVQVFGNDHAVAFAGSQGNFQLNTFKPVMLHNVLVSVEMLAEGCGSFEEHCVRGLAPDAARMKQHLESSLVGATALSPYIGYEKAAQISLTAHREGISLREAALKSGHVTDRQFEDWVRLEAMTGVPKLT